MRFQHPIPHAVQHARELRKKSTPAEILLWNALRNRKFHGLKFRRQVPVGRFIVDFLCTNPLLIIELDGPIHTGRARQDAERTEGIAYDEGIPVLRFSNEEVINRLSHTLHAIERRLIP